MLPQASPQLQIKWLPQASTLSTDQKDLPQPQIKRLPRVPPQLPIKHLPQLQLKWLPQLQIKRIYLNYRSNNYLEHRLNNCLKCRLNHYTWIKQFSRTSYKGYQTVTDSQQNSISRSTKIKLLHHKDFKTISQIQLKQSLSSLHWHQTRLHRHQLQQPQRYQIRQLWRH